MSSLFAQIGGRVGAGSGGVSRAPASIEDDQLADIFNSKLSATDRIALIRTIVESNRGEEFLEKIDTIQLNQKMDCLKEITENARLRKEISNCNAPAVIIDNSKGTLDQ
jgi:F0F1-type ATP synthase delta subunit